MVTERIEITGWVDWCNDGAVMFDGNNINDIFEQFDGDGVKIIIERI